jgi:hypothetical protein
MNRSPVVGMNHGFNLISIHPYFSTGQDCICSVERTLAERTLGLKDFQNVRRPTLQTRVQ